LTHYFVEEGLNNDVYDVNNVHMLDTEAETYSRVCYRWL